MEVDSILTSSTSVMSSRDVTENQKVTTGLAPAEKPSKVVNGGAGAAPQEAHLPPEAAAAAEGKGPAPKAKEESSQMQKLIPDNKIAKLQQSVAPPRPSKAKRIADAAAKKTEDKPKTTTTGAAGLPQRGRAGHQPSEEELRPRQTKLAETGPALPREVGELLHMSS